MHVTDSEKACVTMGNINSTHPCSDSRDLSTVGRNLVDPAGVEFSLTSGLCPGISSHVRLIDLPVVTDPRGDLTFIEGERHVPFPIRRVYYLYNVPVDAERGGHAHRDLEQVVFALSGSFRMRIDDGRTQSEYWLRDPRKGLYINRLIWREMDSFSQGAVCMVLASHPYDEADYFRSYDDFIAAVNKGAQ